MKKIILVLFLSLCIIKILAQQKGANPVSPINQVVSSNNTYAVVVGISDYQDPGIPDLLFADKDAEAFANFLRSPGGGSLNSDHLRVLINNQATAGQVASALYWLVEECKVNDQVIIYFSGHGDVERKFMGQPGFLLCWDAPSRVYMAGGVLEIGMLQTIISTLSLENKVRVTMITDACHSGKLSGSSINGSQLTNANLAKQYANEIKILSCQPNEYSIEGEQWGGGRGAFSYYLVDGLYGMADANKDQSIDLFEISRYLEDHVAKEVAPESQFPITVGNRNEKLAVVIPDLLAQIEKNRSGTLPTFQATESRGIEEMVLAEVDTSIKELYLLFRKALKDKAFLEPTNACADYYYEKLLLEPKLKRLHSTMRRNYAAALQDDAQQVLYKWLKSELGELMLSKISRINKYKLYPRQLQRAAELLGADHYMYPVIQARKHFFEGVLIAIDDLNPNKEVGQKALDKFRSALQCQPNLPYVYLHMSEIFHNKFRQDDSAVHCILYAANLAPTWVLPYLTLAIFYINQNKFEQAKYYLDKSVQVDSSSAFVKWANGVYYEKINEIDSALLEYKRAIQIDSSFNYPYTFIGKIMEDRNSYIEAEIFYKKAIQLDSTDFWSNMKLGGLYKDKMRRFEEAKKYISIAYELDSTQIATRMFMASMLYETKRYGEAEHQYKKILEIDSSTWWAYLFLAWIYFDLNRQQEAEQHCLKAIQFDSTNVNIYNTLTRIYIKTNKYVEAEKFCNKALQLDSTNNYAHFNLARVYFKTRGFDEAEKVLNKLIQIDSANNSSYYDFACFLSIHKKLDKAFYILEHSIKKGNTDYELMQQDSDLKLLREQKERWNALMKKYFPEKFKETKN